jgi:hypothetical protein
LIVDWRKRASLPRFRGCRQIASCGRWTFARQSLSRSRRQTGPAVGGCWIGDREFSVIF